MESTIMTITSEWDSARHRHPSFGEGRDITEFWSSGDDYDWSGYSKIAEDIISDLVKDGVLSDGIGVLDIGCGPGAFARLMSPHVRDVHCVDISEGMINRLKREFDQLGIVNYSADVCDCRSLPDDYKTDVAFVSLCPVFNSPEGILSMERYAERRCVYISSANRAHTIESEIWEALGCDYTYGGYDTRYPYEYLESLGRGATLRYYTQPRVHDESERDCIDRHLRLFSRYRAIDDGLRSIIESIVSKHAVDGIVHIDGEKRLGLLVWTPIE